MANRDIQLVLSIILTLILGGAYTFGSFLGVLSFAKPHHVVWVEAIVATAIPLLILLLIWATTRRTAPSIWKGTAVGIAFVVILCGFCNGMAVIMSKG